MNRNIRIGDRVLCVNNSLYGYWSQRPIANLGLTIGKIYTIVDIRDLNNLNKIRDFNNKNAIGVINDNGELIYYFNMFRLLSEIRRKKLEKLNDINYYEKR